MPGAADEDHESYAKLSARKSKRSETAIVSFLVY